MFSLHHHTKVASFLSIFKLPVNRMVSYKSHYYQTRLNRIDSWEKLYKLSSDSEVVTLTNDKKITFFDIPFGVSLSTITKRFGEPRFILNNTSKIKNHVVYFYKFNFYGVKARCEIHFMNKTFFLASYFFSRSIEDSSKEILMTISQKYLDRNEFEFDNSFQLVDSKGDKLIFEKDVDYIITYFSGDKSMYQTIENKIKEVETVRLSSKKTRQTVLKRAL
jgi:hypothetical protein